MSYGGGNGYADYGNGAGNGNGGQQQDWSGKGFFRQKFKLILNSKLQQNAKDPAKNS